MFVVALAEVEPSKLDAEPALLAPDLGITPYEARQILLAGFPALVLTTPRREDAVALLRNLRARGHGAIAFDASAVVAGDDMVHPKRFRIDAGVMSAFDPMGNLTLELPLADVQSILRATERSRTDTTTETTSTKFSMGRAMLTGGLSLTKKVKHEEHSITHQSQEVVYLFRRSRETPWLIKEREINYDGLGAERDASSMRNFLTLIERLRSLAPSAQYDERLRGVRRLGPAIMRAVTMKTASVSQSTSSQVDLLAHTLALWLSRADRGGMAPEGSHRGTNVTKP